MMNPLIKQMHQRDTIYIHTQNSGDDDYAELLKENHMLILARVEFFTR